MHPNEPLLIEPPPAENYVRRRDAGSLEGELAWVALVLLDRNRRNAEMVIARWGWSGKGKATLQKIGMKFNVTRERVRQIEAKALKRLRRSRFKTPYLDKALMLVTEQNLATCSDIADRLANSNVARRSFDPIGAITAGKLLGRSVTISKIRVGQIDILVSRDLRSVPQWLISEARTLSSKQGAFSVAGLADSASSHFRQVVEDTCVRRILERTPGIRWLDDPHEWAWNSSSKRNRLSNQIWKILTIASGVSLEEIRMAASRWHRMNGFAPPRAVFGEFCRQMRGVSLRDGKVIADRPPNIDSVLGENERTMVSVMREHQGVMARDEFEAECCARGVNVSSFYIYLTYSPLFQKLARGVYCLCGATVRPDQVNKLRKARTAGGTIADFGWTADALVWMSASVTHGILVGGVISIPVGLRPFLDGQFSLVGPDGNSYGGIRCVGAQAWSFSKFFRRSGGDEGDCFLLLWNPIERTVRIYPGVENVEDIVPKVSDEKLLAQIQ